MIEVNTKNIQNKTDTQNSNLEEQNIYITKKDQ